MNSAAPSAERIIGPGSPFELDRDRRFVQPPFTAVDIYNRLRRYGDRTLVVEGDDRFSFQAILRRAFALAQLCGEADLGPGARIALSLDNGADWLAAFIGITGAGAEAVILDPAMAEDARRAVLRAAGCAAIVAAAPGGPPSRGALYELQDGQWGGKAAVAALRTLGRDDGAGAAAGAAERPAFLAVAPDSAALTVFTSGSTGRPKGVRHTHRSLVTAARTAILGAMLSPAPADRAARRAEPVRMILAPLGHVAGLLQAMLALMTGGRLVIRDSSDLDRLLALIEREKVRWLTGASPDLLRDIARAETACDLSSLASFQLHGAAVRSALVEELQARFPQAGVGTGYGMSETAGPIAVATLEELTARPGTSGRVLPTAQAQIRDAAGAALGPGERGEIWVRGAMVMEGYDDADRTRERLVDGWLKTGDVGWLDAEGYIYISHRAGEVVSLADGADIALEEIERCAQGDPGVDEAAALAGPEGGAGVCLAVVARAGAGLSEPRIRGVLERRFGAALAQMVQIRFMDRLPRGRTGKVLKPDLIGLFEAGFESESVA